MIEHVWRGWTTPEDADTYERLLKEDVLPDIADTVGRGYRGHRVLRREAGDEVAFLTILRFETMADVRAIAGTDPTGAHVPDEARALLSRWEDTVEHYELIAEERVSSDTR